MMKTATTIKADPCLGIPVVFDPRSRSIADSRGLWRWKKIVLGSTFLNFPAREQQAMVMHEAGHCKLFHLEKRLLRLWMLFWRPSALAAYCRQQEIEADRFAAAAGYGADLARAFERINAPGDPLHPGLQERILRLKSLA